MSSVHSVAASPNTSLRGDTVPPANTSGAMKRGVPMPTVPVVLLAELARDAEVDEHDRPRSPRIRFCGFTSRWTICCSCTYWSASQAWRVYSIASSTGRPGLPCCSSIPPRSTPSTSSITRYWPRLVLEVVEHPHHARVVELREQARLDLEARGVADVEQPLDRHLRARPRVSSAR